MSNHFPMTSPGEVPRVRPEWTLGDRLRKARIVAGFEEQRSFAAVLGISQPSISNYEADRTRPNRLVLREWARLTGVDEEWLSGGARPGEAVRLERRRRATYTSSEQGRPTSGWSTAGDHVAEVVPIVRPTIHHLA
jgi:transcriptional regulator with XRE-family HTH domain